MSADRPLVLSIAGFDPCGGAGVLADVKTFERCSVQGMALVTAQTIQTERSVLSVTWQPLEDVLRGIDSLMQYYAIRVVKIGIVSDLAFLTSILACIRSHNEDAFIIWDPVLKSSSGFAFFNDSDLQKLPSVWHQIDLITPNYDEYVLLGPCLKTRRPDAILIKGGHRDDEPGTDILQVNDRELRLLPDVDEVFPKHGSGCVLSAAIAAYIASGHDLEDACRKAKSYVERYLNSHTSLLGYHDHVE